ncbi:MAG: hypothetical protein WC436_01990 [Candidatus Babeliales bacterium]
MIFLNKIKKSVFFLACFSGFLSLNCMESNVNSQDFDSYVRHIKMVSQKLEIANKLHIELVINKEFNKNTVPWLNNIEKLNELYKMVAGIQFDCSCMLQYSRCLNLCKSENDLIESNMKNFERIRDRTRATRDKIERSSFIKMYEMLEFIKKRKDLKFKREGMEYLESMLELFKSEYDRNLNEQCDQYGLFGRHTLNDLYDLYKEVESLFYLVRNNLV